MKYQFGNGGNSHKDRIMKVSKEELEIFRDHVTNCRGCDNYVRHKKDLIQKHMKESDIYPSLENTINHIKKCEYCEKQDVFAVLYLKIIVKYLKLRKFFSYFKFWYSKKET